MKNAKNSLKKSKIPIIAISTVFVFGSVCYLTNNCTFLFSHEKYPEIREIKDQNFLKKKNISYKIFDYRFENINSENFVDINKEKKNHLYTIVIPTYHRMSLLKLSLKHYTKFSNISKIIVVWFNEYDMPNSMEILNFLTMDSKVNIEFYGMPNFVRLRYYPYPTIDTEAVLNVDDDILIVEKSAQNAFNHWKVSKQKNKLKKFLISFLFYLFEKL